jgi:hypothetical protein
MDRHERLAMIDKLQEANARTLDDMAVREAQRMAGQESRSWTLPEPEPPKRQAPANLSAAELEQLRSRQWDAWVQAHIARALAQHDKVRLAAMGAALGMMRKQLREEIAAEVGQLRAEVTLQRAHAGAGDNGEVILPWPRRRSDAA